MVAPNVTSPLPTGPFLLHVATEVEASADAAFNRWSESQLLTNLQLPGFLAARRLARWPDWPGAGESPNYLTLYELDAESAIASDSFVANERSIPDGLSPRLRSERSLYREIGVHSVAAAAAMGAAILHVTVDVDPARTDDFLDWYVGEHVPAVLEAPGMIGARRFENVELRAGARLPEGLHSYCTLYEMQEASVISRPETLEASRRGSCPEQLQPHRVAFNHVYEEVQRLPASSGDVISRAPRTGA